MTIIIWRLLCLISMVLFAACVIALFCARLTKNRYYHSFQQDELFKTQKTVNSLNSIYFTSGETRKYIKKYVLCKTLYDKYLVCNYGRRFGSISYFIVQYSKFRRVLSVLSIEETNTGNASKVIALHSHCAYVNVVIGSVDGAQINSRVIRPLSVNKIRLYCFLKSCAYFMALFVVRHLIIEIFGGNYITQYLRDPLNYFAVAGSFVLAILDYFISVLCFRRKNVKSLNGGVLEYEFL